MGIFIIIRNRRIASLRSSMSLDDSLKYHKVLFSNDSTVKCKALEKKRKIIIQPQYAIDRCVVLSNKWIRKLNTAHDFTFFNFPLPIHPFPIPRFSNSHLTCGTFKSGFLVQIKHLSIDPIPFFVLLLQSYLDHLKNMQK